MMWFFLVFLILIAVAASILVVVLKAKNVGVGGKISYPYEPTKLLFSAAERSFLGVLDQAVGNDYRVLGKVRLADLAKVKPGLSKSARQGALNRISGKHLDFVVCKSSDLSIVCAVELNDRSHASQRAQARDNLVTQVCRAIELPLLAIPAKQAYSVDDLREKFLAALKPA